MVIYLADSNLQLHHSVLPSHPRDAIDTYSFKVPELISTEELDNPRHTHIQSPLPPQKN